MASRTGPPECCGTCNDNLLGFLVRVCPDPPPVGVPVAGSFALLYSIVGTGLPRADCGVCIVPPAVLGVAAGPCGFAGNVENGPSWTDLLFGGRPLGFFPLAVLPPLDHAADTVVP